MRAAVVAATLVGWLALAAATLIGWLALAAPASATTVSLTVEAAGAPAPLFTDPVATAPRPVDGGDGSGSHPCDGPAGAPPSATATGALDDAMRAAGISWRGSWDPSFRDFFIDRIGAYASAAPDDYWSLTVNGRYAPGGCLAALAEGDSVRFYYGPTFGEGPGPESGGSAGGGGPSGGSGPSGGGGSGPSGGGGSGPGGGGGSGPGGEGTSGGRGVRAGSATPTHIRAIASRAARYLRRRPRAAGSDWGRLALALRAKRAHVPPGARTRLTFVRHTRTKLNRSVDLLDSGRSVGLLDSGRSVGLLDSGRSVGLLDSGRGREGGTLAAAAAGILGDRLGHLRSDGSVGGETNATALAVLALEATHLHAGHRPPLHRSPRAARRAAAWLARTQLPGGGFGYRPGVPADVDSTGLAAWALARAGRGATARRAAAFVAAVHRAAAFVAAAQNPDGGFPSLPGGESNAQSTGMALLALRLGGIGPRLGRGGGTEPPTAGRIAPPAAGHTEPPTGGPIEPPAAGPIAPPTAGPSPLDYLASLARPDGSLEYAAGSRPTPAWTTAQALLGLSSRARLLS